MGLRSFCGATTFVAWPRALPGKSSYCVLEAWRALANGCYVGGSGGTYDGGSAVVREMIVDSGLGRKQLAENRIQSCMSTGTPQSTIVEGSVLDRCTLR